MNKIHLLSDELINKIAAGEVVERPASVVKELVENAIDAGANDIRIELKEGGCQLIAVTDNGCGMSPEDAPLALVRHATSKIESAEDLFAIHTMGFRGEALASIASVSRLTLLTRQEGSPTGVKIEVADGGELSTIPWDGVCGTSVIIKDLFYNIPARKAFLKKPALEFGYVLELIQALAVSIPDVGFSLIHNNREVFRAPKIAIQIHEYFRGESALRQRMKLVVGEETAAKLIYVTEENPHGIVEALISPPGDDKSTAKGILMFVNGRWVRDKTIRYGILRGYHSHLLRGRYPTCLVHLSLDPALVDVNVHPTKAELRFQYANEVQLVLSQAVRKNLRQGAWTNDFLGAKSTAISATNSLPNPLASASTTDVKPLTQSMPGPFFNEISAASLSGGITKNANSADNSVGTSDAPRETRISFRGKPIQNEPFAWGETQRTSGNLESERPKPPSSPTNPLLELPLWSSLNFIGSYADCYLLFDQGEHLLIVDQHAFHERILFERLLSSPQCLGTSESFLVPESVMVSGSEYAILQEATHRLEAFGVQLAFLPNQTIEVCAVPGLLKQADCEALLHELATGFRSDKTGIEEAPLSHQILSTIACHSAVRAGERLDLSGVQDLLREAEGVDFFHNCPHGRKVFSRISRKDIGKWFDRS